MSPRFVDRACALGVLLEEEPMQELESSPDVWAEPSFEFWRAARFIGRYLFRLVGEIGYTLVGSGIGPSTYILAPRVDLALRM